MRFADFLLQIFILKKAFAKPPPLIRLDLKPLFLYNSIYIDRYKKAINQLSTYPDYYS